MKLGKQHETKAKHFVPKMYDALVRGEGLEPFDAADRIYKDLVGIWQKDTIRRLLPPETKNQVAREMQALSRFPLESKAGLILRGETADTPTHQDSREVIARLEQENARLRKAVEDLESTKKVLIERTLKLERLLAEGRQQRHDGKKGVIKAGEEMIVIPPHLFMKTFALMRSSSKPLVLKVMAREAVDIDRMRI